MSADEARSDCFACETRKSKVIDSDPQGRTGRTRRKCNVPTSELQGLRKDHLGRMRPAHRLGQGRRARRAMVSGAHGGGEERCISGVRILLLADRREEVGVLAGAWRVNATPPLRLMLLGLRLALLGLRLTLLGLRSDGARILKARRHAVSDNQAAVSDDPQRGRLRRSLLHPSSPLVCLFVFHLLFFGRVFRGMRLSCMVVH